MLLGADLDAAPGFEIILSRLISRSLQSTSTQPLKFAGLLYFYFATYEETKLVVRDVAGVIDLGLQRAKDKLLWPASCPRS